MIHIVGSAIKIISKVDVLSGTTVTLHDLKDPDGESILTEEAMSFNDAEETLNASVVWQSTENTHVVGRYTYIIKAANGSNENKARGYFFLEDE